MNQITTTDKIALVGVIIYLSMMIIISFSYMEPFFSNDKYYQLQGVGESKSIQENVVPKVMPKYPNI